MTLPSRVDRACSRPSQVLAKRTPGIAVTAAECDGLQFFLLSHEGGGTDQITFPLVTSKAATPPLASGFFASKLWLAAYKVSPSTAAPHMMPPFRFLPICACQRILPS